MPTQNENLENEELNENSENQNDNNDGNNEQNNNSDQTGSDDIAAQLAALIEENKQLKENSKKWEKRSKSNFSNLRESENEKKTAEERIAALEAELAESKAKDARLAAAQVVAKKSGLAVDAVLLMQGETEDELTESVNAIKAVMPTYPVIEVGKQDITPTAVTAESIRKIKDPVERVRERAKHQDLFK